MNDFDLNRPSLLPKIPFEDDQRRKREPPDSLPCYYTS
jgi:hypothetical protein